MVRETRHLWVGNLPENIREERILEHFKRYGRVQSVKLLPKKDEEASICATVAFIDIKSASKAQCSENKIDERTLKTDYYEPSTTSTAAIHIHERDDTLLRAGGIYNAVRNQRYPHGLSEDRGYERSSHYYERTQDRETYLRRPMSYHEEEVYQGRGRPRERNNSANYRGVVTTGFQNPLERIQPGHYRSHNSRQHFDSQQPQTPQQTQQRYAVEQYNMEERENSTGRGSRRSSPSRAKSRPGRQRQKSTSRSQSHSGSDCHSRSGSQSSCASRSSSSSSNTRSSSSSGSSQSGSHSGSRSQSRSQSPSVSYSSRGSSKANRTAEKTAVLSPAPLLQSTVSTPIPPSSQPSNVNLLTSVTMASESTTNTPTEKEDKRPLGICVRNLPVRSSDTSLKDGLFHEYKKHGKVTTVKVIGQGTERYAVVCFKKPEDVEKALEVSKDKLFFGSKIEVTSHEGLDVEDNEFRPLEAELDEYHPKATRTLFIGNLEKDITTAELRKHFEQFGEIIEIDIKKQGAVSSYAFVQYSDIASVVKAMRKMDGEHLGANRIKLGFGKSMSTNCVWLDGIADPVTEKFLTRQFVRFGPVGSTYIDREKGHALIFYERVEYAQIAVPEMRGRALGGKKLQIDFASRECQVAFFEKMEMSGQLLPGDRPWDRREQNFDTREERYNRDPRLVYENAGRAFGRFETQQRGRAHFRGSQRGNFNSRGRGQGFPNRSYDEEFSQTTGSNYDDSYEQELREYGFSQRERRDYGGDEHSRSFSPRRRRDELSLSPKERHSDGTSPHSRTDRNSSRYDSGREEEGEEKRSKFCEVDKERLIKKNRHRSISDQDSYHSQSPPNSRHESRSISPPAKEKRHKDRPPNRPRSPGTPFDSPDNDAVTFVDRENVAEYKDTGKRKLLENRLEYREPSQTDVTMINDFDVASRLRTKTDTERSKFRKVHNEGDGLNERRDCSLETPSTLKDFGNLFCTSDLTKLANIAGLNPRFLKPNAETERIQFDLDLNDKISNEGKLLESTDIIEEFSEKPVTDSGKDLTHLQKKKVHILHLLEQLEETGSSGDDSNVDTEGRPAKKTKLNDARHYVCNIGRQNAKEIKTSPPSAISKLIDSDGENFECRKSEGNNVAVQQQKILDLKNKGHVDMMDTCGVSEVLEDICFGFSNSPKSTSNNFLHKRRKSSSFSEDINCGKHLVHPISTSEESFDFSAVDIDLSSSENQSSKTDVRLMTAKSPDSKPGTPLVDEPRREKESPLSLPLPRFALNNTSVHSPRHSPMPVMSPKSSILKSPLMSPTGGCNINNLSTVSRELVCSDVLTCKNSPSVISLNTSEKSSSNVIDVKHKYSTCFSTTGSVVNNSKNNSLDSSSDSEHSPRLSPNCPSLDERIRILDEKYNAWSGSTRNIGHTITTSSDSLIKLDYEKFIKKRPSFLSTDITQLRTEPSDIVKSLLAKNSIFDQDSKRLEHINEKYEPREVTLDPSPKKTFCFRTKAAAKEFSPAISSPLPRHTVNSILSTSIMRYPYASSTTVTTSSQPVTQTAVTTTVTITHASQSSNVTSSASLTSPISSYPSMSFSPVTLTTTSHSPNSTRTDVSHKPASAVSTRKSSLESPKTPILRRESTLGITTVAPSPVRVPVNVTSSLTSPVTVTTSSTNILTVAAKRETPSGLTNRKEQNMVLKKDSKDPCTKRDVSCNNSFANFKDASRKETSSVGNISKEKTCVLRDTKKDPFLVVNNNKDCLMKKDIVPCNNNNREMYVKRETVQNNATKENQIRKENGVHNIPNKEMTRKDTTQVNNKRRLVSSDSNESESSRMSTKGEMKSEKDSKLKLDVKSQEPETKKPKVSSSNEDKKKNDKLERKASKSDSKYEKKEEKDKKCELKNIVDEKDKTKLESSTKVKEEKKCKSQKDVKDNAKSDSHSKRKNSTDSKNKEKKKDKKKDKKDKEKSDREKCKDKKTEKCKSDSSKHDKKAERCFNYLDEEPVYFSMYDKVKARSSQNEKAKEKEKELESMREKFSQLKKSRAKREEKIKNSSVEYDSDKASDAGSMPSSEASESKFSTKNKHILKKRKFFIPSDSEDDSDCKERKKSVQKSEDVKSDELSETEMPKESKNEKAKFKLKNDKSCLKSGCESSDVEAPVRPKECSNRKHKGKSKKKHDKEKSKPRKKSDDDSSDAEGSARTKWHNLKTDKMKKLKPHVTKVSEDESADSENLKGGEKVKFNKEEKQESSSPEGEQKVRKVSVKKENKKKKEKQKETFADVETSDEEQQEKIKLNRRKRSRKTSKNRDKKIQEKQTFMETTPVVKKEEDPVEIEMKVEEEPAPPMEEIKMEGCFDKYNSSHILAFSEDSLSNIAVLEKPLNFGLESEKSDSEHNITGPTISESNMPKLSLKEEDEEERLEMFSDSKETLEIFDKFLNNDLSSEESKVTKPLWLDDNLEEQNISLSDKNGIGELESNKCDMRINSEMSCTDFKPELPDLSTYDLDLNMPSLLDPPVKDERKPKKSRKSYKDKRRRSNRDDGAPKLDDVFHLIESNNEPTITSISFSEAEEMATTENTEDCKSLLPDSAELVEAVRVLESQLQESMIQSQNIIKPEEPLPEAPSPVPNETIEDMDDDKDFGMSSFAKLIVDESKMEENEKSDQEKENSEQKQGPLDIFEFTDDDDMEIPSKYAREENKRYRTQEEDSYEAKNRKAKVKKKKKNGKEDLSRKDDPKVFQEESKIIEEEAVKSPEKTMDLPELKAEPAFDKPLLHDVIPDLIAATENIPPADMHPVLEEKEPELETEQDPEDKGTSAISQEETEDAVKALLQATFGTDTYDSQDAQFSEEIVPKLEPILDELSKEESVDELPTEMTIDDQDISLTHEKEEEMPENRNEVPEEVTSEFTEDTVKECVEEKTENCLSLFVEEKNDTSVLQEEEEFHSSIEEIPERPKSADIDFQAVNIPEMPAVSVTEEVEKPEETCVDVKDEQNDVPVCEEKPLIATPSESAPVEIPSSPEQLIPVSSPLPPAPIPETVPEVTEPEEPIKTNENVSTFQELEVVPPPPTNFEMPILDVEEKPSVENSVPVETRGRRGRRGKGRKHSEPISKPEMSVIDEVFPVSPSVNKQSNKRGRRNARSEFEIGSPDLKDGLDMPRLEETLCSESKVATENDQNITPYEDNLKTAVNSGDTPTDDSKEEMPPLLEASVAEAIECFNIMLKDDRPTPETAPAEKIVETPKIEETKNKRRGRKKKFETTVTLPSPPTLEKMEVKFEDIEETKVKENRFEVRHHAQEQKSITESKGSDYDVFEFRDDDEDDAVTSFESSKEKKEEVKFGETKFIPDERKLTFHESERKDEEKSETIIKDDRDVIVERSRPRLILTIKSPHKDSLEKVAKVETREEPTVRIVEHRVDDHRNESTFATPHFLCLHSELMEQSEKSMPSQSSGKSATRKSQRLQEKSYRTTIDEVIEDVVKGHFSNIDNYEPPAILRTTRRTRRGLTRIDDSLSSHVDKQEILGIPSVQQSTENRMEQPEPSSEITTSESDHANVTAIEASKPANPETSEIPRTVSLRTFRITRTQTRAENVKSDIIGSVLQENTSASINDAKDSDNSKDILSKTNASTLLETPGSVHSTVTIHDVKLQDTKGISENLMDTKVEVKAERDRINNSSTMDKPPSLQTQLVMKVELPKVSQNFPANKIDPSRDRTASSDDKDVDCSPTALVDPVTGFLTPVRQSEEGTYVPATVNSSGITTSANTVNEDTVSVSTCIKTAQSQPVTAAHAPVVISAKSHTIVSSSAPMLPPPISTTEAIKSPQPIISLATPSKSPHPQLVPSPQSYNTAIKEEQEHLTSRSRSQSLPRVTYVGEPPVDVSARSRSQSLSGTPSTENDTRILHPAMIARPSTQIGQPMAGLPSHSWSYAPAVSNPSSVSLKTSQIPTAKSPSIANMSNPNPVIGMPPVATGSSIVKSASSKANVQPTVRTNEMSAVVMRSVPSEIAVVYKSEPGLPPSSCSGKATISRSTVDLVSQSATVGSETCHQSRRESAQSRISNIKSQTPTTLSSSMSSSSSKSPVQSRQNPVILQQQAAYPLPAYEAALHATHPYGPTSAGGGVIADLLQNSNYILQPHKDYLTSHHTSNQLMDRVSSQLVRPSTPVAVHPEVAARLGNPTPPHTPTPPNHPSITAQADMMHLRHPSQPLVVHPHHSHVGVRHSSDLPAAFMHQQLVYAHPHYATVLHPDLRAQQAAALQGMQARMPFSMGSGSAVRISSECRSASDITKTDTKELRTDIKNVTVKEEKPERTRDEKTSVVESGRGSGESSSTSRNSALSAVNQLPVRQPQAQYPSGLPSLRQVTPHLALSPHDRTTDSPIVANLYTQGQNPRISYSRSDQSKSSDPRALEGEVVHPRQLSQPSTVYVDPRSQTSVALPTLAKQEIQRTISQQSQQQQRQQQQQQQQQQQPQQQQPQPQQSHSRSPAASIRPPSPPPAHSRNFSSSYVHSGCEVPPTPQPGSEAPLHPTPHILSQPVVQPRTQLQTPPHASQVPPQGDSLLMLLQRYPVMWQGLLALKNDQAAVQMHFVSGNHHVAISSLPSMSEGGTPPLRIAQRMRLEQTQLEGVARRMQMEGEHCMLLALPCGRDHMDVLQQSNNLRNGFITYLQQKQAAGIVNVAAPGSQQPAYVVHIFPSCEFSNENLARIAPDLLHSVTDIAHLLIVIATV